MNADLLKRWIVGKPMPLAQARHERLSKTIALAVFSSAALSSVAYATEEILVRSPSAIPKAVYHELDPARTLRLDERWARGGCGVSLVVLCAPYRSVRGPLFDFIERIKSQVPHGVITIVVVNAPFHLKS